MDITHVTAVMEQALELMESFVALDPANPEPRAEIRARLTRLDADLKDLMNAAQGKVR